MSTIPSAEWYAERARYDLFRQTKLGAAFERFTNALTSAGMADGNPHTHDHSLTKAWDRERAARAELLVLLHQYALNEITS